MNSELRPYKVYAIKEGTVIDHIPPFKAMKVIEILGANEPGDSIVTVGINMESKKKGRKDVVKIENKTLTKEHLNKIALIAPSATINIIKDHNVAEKRKVEVPNEIKGSIKCANPNCITRKQDVKTYFHVAEKDPLKVKCHYCEKVFEGDDILI